MVLVAGGRRRWNNEFKGRTNTTEWLAEPRLVKSQVRQIKTFGFDPGGNSELAKGMTLLDGRSGCSLGKELKA